MPDRENRRQRRFLKRRAEILSAAAPVLTALGGITPPPSPEQCRALAETAVDLLLDGIRVRGDGK
jgi:hypothetical protein